MSAPGHEGDTHHHGITEGLHNLKVKAIHQKYGITLFTLSHSANNIV